MFLLLYEVRDESKTTLTHSRAPSPGYPHLKFQTQQDDPISPLWHHNYHHYDDGETEWSPTNHHNYLNLGMYQMVKDAC